MYKKILFSILLVFLFSGCTTKYIPIQNKVVDHRDLSLDFVKDNYVLVEQGCSNSKQRWFYYFLPLSGFRVFTDEYVIDEMLTECKGDVVTNVELYDTEFISLVVNFYIRSARGNVWRKK